MAPKKAPAAAAKKAPVAAPKKATETVKKAESVVKTTVVAPAAKAAAAEKPGRKKVQFDAPAPAKPTPPPAGVVVAKSSAAGKKKPAAAAAATKRAREEVTASGKKRPATKKDEELEDSSDEDDQASTSSDDLSDLADGSSSSDDEDDSSKQQKPSKVSYRVVVLRYLPREFQEPELHKFLGQFGARVSNCFCVRSKRTNESKGTAYVQFDNEAVLPTVVEECNGMSLGGRTVRARIREMHRPMPTKQNIRIRRLKGARHSAHGPQLIQHNVSDKSIVAQLVKYSRAERKNNEALKKLGIDFESNAFDNQLKRLPKNLFVDKKARQAIVAAKRVAEAEKKAARNKSRQQPAKPQQADKPETSAAAPAAAKKEAAPSPKQTKKIAAKK